MALTPERQGTRAWSSGAVGEERVAAAVDAIAGQSIRVLHDRKIRRSKANIDHLVVTPAGVWVIDSKRYQDRRPELRVDGGVLRPRVEKLLVGPQARTATAVVCTEGAKHEQGRRRRVNRSIVGAASSAGPGWLPPARRAVAEPSRWERAVYACRNSIAMFTGADKGSLRTCARSVQIVACPPGPAPPS